MELTFWSSLGGVVQESLQEIVEEYNQDHTIKVRLETIAPQLYQSAALEGLKREKGARPDFILAPEFMTGTMRKSLDEGTLISVKSLLDKDRQEDIAQIVRRTFGEDSLPFNPACGILYMNRTLLDSEGFPPDWRPETFEEFISATRQLKKGYTAAWPEAYLIEMVLAQQNRSLFDSDGGYNFSQLVDHIMDLRELTQEGVFLPPAVGNYDPTRAVFIEGKAAFYMQGSGHASLIDKEGKEQGFQVDYAPLPRLSLGQRVKYALPLGGAAIWVVNNEMSEGTETEKMVAGVRSFLNFLASPKVQDEWHMKTAYVPVSQSIRSRLSEFYKTHKLHEAVIEQTIEAPIGEHSFGVKKNGYHIVRGKLYPLIRELLLLQGSKEEVKEIIEKRLKRFDEESNS